MEKVSTNIYRISQYLEFIVDNYLYLGFKELSVDQQVTDQAVFNIKHNILLSMFAALSCLSQGLFIQSGTILRTVIEDCLVLVDFFKNQGQVERFLQGNYSTRGLISRIKNSIPKNVVSWYGYFSSNFSHFGPLHPSPYMPRSCYPDNFLLVTGLQNIVRIIVTFHIVLERIYLKDCKQPMFWNYRDYDNCPIFNEDSIVFTWAEKIGNDIVNKYPPDERKEGMDYEDKQYKLK
jgi:hypothetical protein